MEILWKVDMYTVNDKIEDKGDSDPEQNGRDNNTDVDGSLRSPFSKSFSFAKIPPRERALFDITNFEENRRNTHESVMSKNELYWNELLKMQEEACADSEQLLHYFRCKHAAVLSFSTSLDSILLENSPKGGSISSHTYSTSTSLHSAQGPGQRARQELVNLDKIWSQRISGMAESLESDIIKPFEIVHKDFIEDITAMGRRCANLFHAVRLADLRVQSYYDEIDEASSSTSITPKKLQAPIVSRNSISLSSGGPLQTCHVAGTEEPFQDMWLLDMCYRVAVVRHIQMKDECSRQLGRLLVRAKDAEMKRREAIAKATDQLAQMQVELWIHLPAIASSSISLIHARVAEVNVSIDISATLRERVQAHQNAQSLNLSQSSNSSNSSNTNGSNGSNGNSSSHMSLSRTNSMSTSTSSGQNQNNNQREEIKETKEDISRLSSPLESPLLTRSAVFLRRDGGTIVASWVPVLLFLTVDRWLHVFDLDAKCERMSDVAAFHTLVSASKKGLELSVSQQTSLCEETEFDPKITTQVLRSESFMTPTYSMLLSRCKIMFKPSVNDTTFEVVEAVPNTGVGAMFKATFERRYVFRGRSQVDMVDWIVLLKGEL